jgi:hypothetical protein
MEVWYVSTLARGGILSAGQNDEVESDETTINKQLFIQGRRLTAI